MICNYNDASFFRYLFLCQFLPLYDHGEGKAVLIHCRKTAADIVVKFLQSGDDNWVLSFMIVSDILFIIKYIIQEMIN